MVVGLSGFEGVEIERTCQFLAHARTLIPWMKTYVKRLQRGKTPGHHWALNVDVGLQIIVTKAVWLSMRRRGNV